MASHQGAQALSDKPLTISNWKEAQARGNGLERLWATIEAEETANVPSRVWISLASRRQLEQQWHQLSQSSRNALPLYGVPFAVKDNIDAEGFPTTAGCPSFSTTAATSDAPVVQRLKAAGAILIGKTNLDQFATGLVGTRSPYGAVPNSFDSARVSGGSSSGSAVAVARGAVPFSLGTDTAGSGRVPAGLNNIVGLKPTRGALSARKVVPACRTLDCVSIFALTVEDAETVLSIAEGYDVLDAYSRPRPNPRNGSDLDGFGGRVVGANPFLAICAAPEWHGYSEHSLAYEAALDKARSLGWRLEEVDFTPLLELAQLLYSGPWVAERYQAIRTFIEQVDTSEMDPVVRGIIMNAERFSAADAFESEYRRQDLTRQIQQAFGRFDGLLVSTTPTFPTLEQLAQRPVEENSKLGTYTNFVNFLDWSALSIPAGFRPDGLPFGITLIADKWQEPKLITWANVWLSVESRRLGATAAQISERQKPVIALQPSRNDVTQIAVVGAHLSGLPLNKDLLSRDATLVAATHTSDQYRLFALNVPGPRKPGLRRVASHDEEGTNIEVEIWNLPSTALADFMTTIQHPLAIGKVELQDSSWVHGFVCEPSGLVGATEITCFGGWRPYIAALDKKVSNLSNELAGPPIRKVLVANRGEIAFRIVKTLHKMSLQAIAIFSSTDAKAPHVRDADASFMLEGHTVSETYLNIPQIIAIAKSSGADAIIPGYGFLSENADFAIAVQKVGMTWVGPTPQQMSDLGLKHKAREIAIAAEVPTVPGSQGLLASIEEALEQAKTIGYPLMLKSTAGGGGIGLSHCTSESDLRRAFDSVQRQAQANFGNPGVFLERYIEKARHIEVQVLGDGHGHVVAVGERDCSLQRRHQKVVEESPAAMVPAEVRRKMEAAAVRLASSVNYLNVGTVEFVYDVETYDFYFLEVNTRLQVEHPITELVTTLDLVECMIMIASGQWEQLFPDPKSQINVKGAAIEVRLYAENPIRQFQPCSGRITKLQFPSSLRVDTWIEEGTDVTTSYDPLIAKLIAYGTDRLDAVKKLAAGLSATVVEGVQSNLEYLREIVASDFFESGDYTTKSLDSFQFISNSFEVLEPGPLTTIQDFPGRTGHWSIGVPPSGPMDAVSFQMANKLVGNAPGAAGLECTLQGLTMKFHCVTALVVTGGAAPVTLDTVPVPMDSIIHVLAGQIVHVGALSHGYRVYIAIRGGIDVPYVMGSRSTFEVGRLGGFHGRKLQARDIVSIFPSNSKETSQVSGQSLCAPPIPRQPFAEWTLRVIPGPHAAPDYFTMDGFKDLFSGTWTVHHNSNRLGVRLTGAHPRWARSSGGKAGLHPSNIHDSPYSIGSMSFTGDEAVILTSDGPSLGGFVVFCVVASADMWKVGQVRPGDNIRLEAISVDAAIELEMNQIPGKWEFDGSSGKNKSTDLQSFIPAPITLGSLGGCGQLVQARQAGDQALLLEFGEAKEFNMKQSIAIFAFCDKHQRDPIAGVEELTPGVFTIHIIYKRGLQPRTIADRIAEHVRFCKIPGSVPSRLISLPLAFDDSICEAAVQRYSATIRNEAPWLPSNVKFLEKLNDIGNISEMLDDATFLVLGLGDVFMGSPCAIPLDPRHRLFGTKYNPSRSFTPRGAVGIGGQYMCIYAADSPGGYQLVGRTKEIWDSRLVPVEKCQFRLEKGSCRVDPWMFRLFDRIKFYPVTERQLDSKPAEDLIQVIDGNLYLQEYEEWLQLNSDDIAARAFSQAQAIASSPFIDELRHPQGSDTCYPIASLDGKSPHSNNTGDYVKAMMPGRCYKVNVKEGDVIQEGDVLICIESSKMEVEVRSPRSGTCVDVLVAPGDLVDADGNLVFLEPA